MQTAIPFNTMRDVPLEKTQEISQGKPFDVLGMLSQFHCCSPVFPNDIGSVVRILDNETV